VLALSCIPDAAIDPVRADGGNGSGADVRGHASHVSVSSLLRRPGLLVFTACILLFHLANASMLPLVGSDVTMRSSRWATALVAACIIAPQIVVAAISPKVGQLAQDWGRRPLLLIGFGVLPLRGALLASTSDPYAIVAVQALDGLSGAVLGVLVPLTLADLSRGTGRFNLAQGIVGCATGVGAALSTVGAGILADRLGTSIAFAGLAAMALLALLTGALLMPETRSAAAPPTPET
jgi:MFS family permease